jgi:hypothetical protein
VAPADVPALLMEPPIRDRVVRALAVGQPPHLG